MTDEVNPSGTARSAVIVNDPAPPPPIKMESVTSDTGNATASADPKKEESISSTSQTAANIASNGVRAPDNPLPPTNPGTVAQSVNQPSATVLHAGALAPLRANQEDIGDARSGTLLASVVQANRAQELEPNPLHDYAHYTYNFILAAMTRDEYNFLVKNNVNFYSTGYKPSNVIIASAGRRNQQLTRDPRFKKDFYISEMKFTTVVGMNARTRSSNVAELQFKIEEPMGVSFFDRLYEMASALGFKNYLEVPFLLIIEFMGYRDDGTPDQSSKLKAHTKFLPIKLAKVKLQVTNSGSEYSVIAIPYNHISYLTSEHGSAQANFQISAKTVGEFFAERDAEALAKEIETEQRELDRKLENIKQLQDVFPGGGIGVSERDVRTIINDEKLAFAKKYHNAQSYAQALNAFERQAKSLGQVGNTHIYRFVIDPEIANAKIVDFVKLPATRTPFGNKGSNARGSNVENGQDGLFAINAGTSNIDVINMVMKNSSYIRDQIKELPPNSDPEVLAESIAKPLNWFKIIPSVQIKEYDDKRNVYSKEIIYFVTKYQIANTKSPLVPKSIIRNYMREYKYIFTGDNRDILDLQIEFDTLYFTMATIDRNKWNYLNSSPTSQIDNITTASRNGVGSFQPLKTLAFSSNAPMQSGDASIDTSKGIAVSDLWNSVLGSAKGDMINVNLKIIGDPRYIKQDDVFFTPFESTVGNTLPHSTITNLERNVVLFDRNERFVKLTFKTPVDYNDKGLLEKDDDFKTSRFTGIYRVIKVDNLFSKGKFEQVLTLVKVFGQDTDFAIFQEQQQRGALESDPAFGGVGRIPDARKEDSSDSSGTNKSTFATASDQTTNTAQSRVASLAFTGQSSQTQSPSTEDAASTV